MKREKKDNIKKKKAKEKSRREIQLLVSSIMKKRVEKLKWCE